MMELVYKGAELKKSFTEPSVVQCLDETSMHFQARAVELVRGGDKFPWGKALLRSLQEEASAWQQFYNLLQSKMRPANLNLAILPFLPPKGQGNGKKCEGKSINKGKTIKTSFNNNDRKSICKRWTDNRGCNLPNCKFLHECDVVLESNGRVCSAEHKRTEHNTTQHGKPAVR